MLRRTALLATLLAPAIPAIGPAQAQVQTQVQTQVTPDRATMVQQQIQDWLHNTVGIPVKPGSTPVRVTAAGDHFDLAIPLGSSPDTPTMTGKMTDAGNGRWAVDDLAIPSPSVFHYQLPPAKTPDAPSGDVTSTVTIGSQKYHAMFDPSFATPSTSTTALTDMSITTVGTNLTQLTHVDSGSGTATMTPVADGRVDVAIDSGLDGYTIKMSTGPGAAPIAVSMGKVSMLANLAGVSRDRAMEVLQQVSSQRPNATSAQATTAAPANPKSAPDAQKMTALLIALADLTKGVTVDEKVNDLAVTTANLTGTLKLLSIGLTSTAAAGKLQARMPLAAEGLALPDIGLGSMASLIPTRLAFTPAIGAVPTDALMQISRKLIAKQDPNDDDVAALFAQGPITANVENLDLAMAGATFTGGFNTLMTGPSKVSGTGKIVATDIDKLQQAMAADPQTAQFAPVVIFLKGIGRSEQSRLVWDVIYNDGRLLVNGQDMAALMGSPAQAAPQQPARPRPARPAPNRP